MGGNPWQSIECQGWAHRQELLNLVHQPYYRIKDNKEKYEKKLIRVKKSNFSIDVESIPGISGASGRVNMCKRQLGGSWGSLGGFLVASWKFLEVSWRPWIVPLKPKLLLN